MIEKKIGRNKSMNRKPAMKEVMKINEWSNCAVVDSRLASICTASSNLCPGVTPPYQRVLSCVDSKGEEAVGVWLRNIPHRVDI